MFPISITAAEITVAVTFIILLTTFLEKTFKVDFIGRRIFRFLWRLIKFFARWFFLPWKPQIKAVKKTVFAGRDLEITFNAYLANEKAKNEQSAHIQATVEQIKKELSFNGGGSMKDAVFTLRENDERKMMMLNELSDGAKLNSLRLDINDESCQRMTFRLDARKRCTQISETFLRRFGYTERDMLGLDWDFCIAPRSRAKVAREWKRAFERRAMYRNDQIIIASDGIEYECLVRGFPMFNSFDELVGYFGTVEILEEDI